MTDYGGFIFIFDEPKRAEVLKDYIERGFVFTESLSSVDWQAKAFEVCLLCFDSEQISHAALAVRRGKAATAKHRVEFSNYVDFEPAIRFEEIAQIIPHRYDQHLTRASSGVGGRVPPRTWDELINAISYLRPENAEKLRRLIELRLELQQSRSGKVYEVVAQEKDATGLALEFSEFDRRTMLTQWYQDEHEAPAPFLNGLTHLEPLEDAMIDHDMRVFGDWRKWTGSPVGMAVFENGDDRVTVVNANRTALETTLGIDLLYYHDRFKSYVMVQYKRMEAEDRDWVYRPDEQFEKELMRMREFQQDNPDIATNLQIVDYRLHPGLFYLKLCPQRVFEPYSPDLIRGMYLPIEYFDILKTSPEMRGKNQGLRIAWGKATRYMNNTLFIDLVRDGWIGARTVTSDTLTEIIRDSLEGKRSLTLAKKTSNTNPSRSRRVSGAPDYDVADREDQQGDTELANSV